MEDRLETLNDYMGRIREYVLYSIGSPVVVDAARKIVLECQPYDKRCETLKVWEFVTNRMRYAPAPAKYGVEILQTPEKLLGDIDRLGRASGECEEMIVLFAGLLGALNHEIVLVYGGGRLLLDDGRKFPNYRHVWLADRLPETGIEWVHLDPTGYGKFGYELLPGQHFDFEVIGWDFLHE